MHKTVLSVFVAFLAVAVVVGVETTPESAKSTSVSGFGRIKLKIKGQWVSIETLRDTAYTALNEKGLTPPRDLKPVVDFVPSEKVFVRVTFWQGIGKRSWFVEFDRDGNVLIAGSAIVKG